MQQATFHGAAEFGSYARLPLAWLQTTGMGVSPDFFRIVIADDGVHIDGRWRSFRALMPRTSCALGDIVSVTKRERLVILNFADDDYWSIRSTKADDIIRALEARQVPITGNS